jgi:hypothetical protein
MKFGTDLTTANCIYIYMSQVITSGLKVCFVTGELMFLHAAVLLFAILLLLFLKVLILADVLIASLFLFADVQKRLNLSIFLSSCPFSEFIKKGNNIKLSFSVCVDVKFDFCFG